MEIKSQGILLQAIPYLGKSRILKVFTEDFGLISMMAKKPTPAAPFCIAEWVYRKKQSEIFALLESSLTDNLLTLRESYAALRAAGSIAHDLIRTQMPGKNAPNLYRLLTSYFQKIPNFRNPEILAASFRLKLLLHEGLLALQPHCARCRREASLLDQGESVCPEHATPGSIAFSIPEWSGLHALAFSRRFSSLEELAPSPSLDNKIFSLFEGLYTLTT